MVRYPELCAGPDFSPEYSELTSRLGKLCRPFALLHDLRAVDPYAVDWGTPYLSCARRVAAAGFVRRVAFVCDCNHFALATFNTFLWMSPVRPVCAFRDYDQATKWCMKMEDTEK